MRRIRYSALVGALRGRPPLVVGAVACALLGGAPLFSQTPAQPESPGGVCEALCEASWSCCREPEFGAQWRRGCAALEFVVCPTGDRDALLAVDALLAASEGDDPCDFDSIWAQWMARRTPCPSGSMAAPQSGRSGLDAVLVCSAGSAWRAGSERGFEAALGWSSQAVTWKTWSIGVDVIISGGVR